MNQNDQLKLKSHDSPNAKNLVEMARQQAARHGGETAYLFLPDGGGDNGQILSYAALDEKARAIAAVLQEKGLAGQRVLLLYPPGLDYIAGFFGCLYAGAVAVPAYPPHPGQLERSLERLNAILADCRAKAALSIQTIVDIAPSFFNLASRFESLEWIATDGLNPQSHSAWREPNIEPADLAFLQYTSGSTGAPKGVMLCHGNILANQELIREAFETDATCRSFGWLPPYHDMGLIGSILHPFYMGFSFTFISPLDFLKNPLSWPEGMSRFQCTHSGGPNFAYELCVRKITPEQRDRLDLSSWRLAFTGAEPVRLEVLQRFVDYFRPCGFRAEAFHPCYGLAEAALIVTGGWHHRPVRHKTLQKKALQGMKMVEAIPTEPATATLVGCGKSLGGQIVRIMDPNTSRPCSPHEIGEIWVQGPSVALGYWEKPEINREIFQAYAADSQEGPFLRTGDLGFFEDEELYITGRLKDVLIFRGQNYYPQDIEWSVETSVKGVRPGCGAAFAIEVDGEEKLVTVFEVDRRHRERRRQTADLPPGLDRRECNDRRQSSILPGNEPREPGEFEAGAVFAAIRDCILQKNQLKVHAIVLLKPGTIPKTSSGKIQRSACKRAFLENHLEIIAQWAESAPSNEAESDADGVSLSPGFEALKCWFENKLRIICGASQRKLDLDLSLQALGLDSLEALSCLAELEAFLGRSLNSNLLSRFPTLRSLIGHLAAAAPVRSHVAKPITRAEGESKFAKYVNPPLASRMEEIGVDKEFIKGEGCYVYDREGNVYLDFLAAYGALPFGYNPPAIWEAIDEVRSRLEPNLIQPSLLGAAGDLAEKLLQWTQGNFHYAVFSNSGTEAVEAALKLALAATGRRQILATENSFHGKTLAALSATNRDCYQIPFGAPWAGFQKVPYGDADALQELLSGQGPNFAAFLLEPIQGEGGIRVPPAGYLRKAKELCAQYGVALIFDEVQTGLGRTGRLFAYEEEGVVPDILVLAKALGGGLIPIGATLCSEGFYCDAFALNHSSTFGGNTLACRVGLKSLELLTGDQGRLPRQVRENGEFLKKSLNELRERFPRWIKEVRGRGYLLGIEFQKGRDALGEASALGVLAEQGKLAPLIASFLLHGHRIRVAVALNDAHVLRIEPPLIAERAHCETLVGALEDALLQLQGRRYHALFAPLLNKEAPAVRKIDRREREGKWAFVFHMLEEADLLRFDPAFGAFDDAEIRSLAKFFQRSVKPFVAGAAHIESKCGKRAYGEFIAIPKTARELMAMAHERAVEEIQHGVELAKMRGARIVGLGAFSSIVTAGGHDLRHLDVPLTSGNHYTVVAGVQAIHQALPLIFHKGEERTLAVIGAGGSIGRMVSILLAEEFSKLILVGNPKHPAQSLTQLQRVGVEILQNFMRQRERLSPSGNSTLTGAFFEKISLQEFRSGETNLEKILAELIDAEKIILTVEVDRWLVSADVLVTATSNPHPWLKAEHLKPNALVCEISRPANAGKDVKTSRPDVCFIDGGVVEIPGKPYLGANFGLKPGQAYACMAETMLWGLEQRYQHFGIGQTLELQTIHNLRGLSQEHGFRIPRFEKRR